MLQCITLGSTAIEGNVTEELEDGIHLNVTARVDCFLVFCKSKFD